MALEQELMLLHHPIDALVVRGLTPLGQGTPPQKGMDPAIPIGRQVSDDSLDLGHERVGREGRTPDPPGRAFLDLLDKVGASDAKHVGHRLHRELA
jgi:hypothetical protein